MNRPSEIIDAVASLNPVPSDDVDGVTDGAEALKALMTRIADSPPPRRRYLQARSALLALTLAAVLTVPAVAASGRLDSLFGLSNPGTSVDESGLSLQGIAALDRVGGANETVKLLGERDDLAVYVARSARADLCFGVGPAAGSAISFDRLDCRDFEDQAFPSPEQPVADLSVFHGRMGDPSIYLGRLVGVAADGVAEVGFLTPTGARHTSPVVDNIYVDRDPPQQPVSALIALDHEGRVVWRDDSARRFAN